MQAIDNLFLCSETLLTPNNELIPIMPRGSMFDLEIYYYFGM